MCVVRALISFKHGDSPRFVNGYLDEAVNTIAGEGFTDLLEEKVAAQWLSMLAVVANITPGSCGILRVPGVALCFALYTSRARGVARSSAARIDAGRLSRHSREGNGRHAERSLVLA